MSKQDFVAPLKAQWPADTVERRSCFGMELAPVYADVCVKRWQAFTGQMATLEATGKTFAEMDARHGE